MRIFLPAVALLAAAPTSAQPTADSFTSPTPAGVSAEAVRAGMDYRDFRQALLGAGWQSVRDPACETNVYGAPGALSEADNVCHQLPEIEACSGDGYCVMTFSGPSGRRIRVTTYGDYSAWNEPEALGVLGWEQE
jgi:hypothetical protein